MGILSSANTALDTIFDKLKTLKDNILGGILSVPLVKTALVVAANIIIAVNVLKIIKKLPTKISSLQTEITSRCSWNPWLLTQTIASKHGCLASFNRLVTLSPNY